RPASAAALADLLARRRADEPLYVLGQGSNLVLDGELPGLTLIPALDHLDYQVDGDQAWVTAGAGVVWDRLVADTVARGWRGLENLSLIPGTAGAAPFQNIGAYGVELADVLDSVEAVSVADGAVVRFSAAECEFDYRDSLFKSRRRGEFIITAITLRLRRHGACRVDYGGLAARFADADPASLDPAAVRAAVIELRQSKLPDPAVLPNAGSFFKNPVVSVAHYQQLKQAEPELVAFAHRDGMKLAAGWLIERAGWKGRRLGPVGMHREQALVLVNHGGARAADVRALAEAVRADVRERFAVTLEQEPIPLP
ncbi:UDP-N-acetylmuramate dehydrogenase, partial [Alloalcanivorax gelatiniphagus]